MAIRLTVQMKVKPDRAEEFEAVVREAARRVRAEDPGCEQYDTFRSIDEPGVYAMVEAWSTKEEMKAHMSSAATAEMLKVGPFLAGRPVVHRYEDKPKEERS